MTQRTREEKDSGQWPFQDLPGSWRWVPFDEAFTNKTSSERKLPQKRYESSGELAVVDQGQSLVAGFTNSAALCHTAALPVIIFGDHTRCVKFVDFPFVQGADGVKVLQPREILDPRFAFHALRTVVLPDRGYARHYKFLAATRFPVPTIDEQRRIVAKLEALQARSRRARQALDAVPPLLQKLRQSILAAAFRGDLTKDWRAKNKDIEPATELLKRIRTERRQKWEEAELAKLKAKGKPPKDDRWKAKYKEPQPVDTAGLPELPEGWCWASVDELTVFVTDGEHATPPRTPEGVLLLSARNIGDGQLRLENVDHISESTHKQLSKRLSIQEGDVLLSCSGSVGRSCVVPTDIEFSLVRSVAVLRPVLAASGDWISFSIRSPVTQHLVDERKTETAQANLFQGKIRLLPVAIAPTNEQRVVLNRIRAALNRAECTREILNAIAHSRETLEHAVLSKAFRGGLLLGLNRRKPGQL